MFLRLLLTSLPFSAAFAQTDTIFFRINQITTREHADTYRPTPIKQNEKYKVVDYFLSDHKVAREGYSYSIDSMIYDGPYVEYYQNGRKRQYGNYLKGNKVGQWRLRYEDTDRIWAVTTYIPGADTNEILTSFYRNAKVKRKEYTAKGKATGICYNELGAEITFTPFEQMPGFNGNVNEFLGRTIRYPNEARYKGIDGKVLVQFIVNEDGTIEIARTIGPHESLCRESERVAKLMPKWNPGKIDDQPVKVYFTLPMLFRLE